MARALSVIVLAHDEETEPARLPCEHPAARGRGLRRRLRQHRSHGRDRARGRLPGGPASVRELRPPAQLGLRQPRDRDPLDPLPRRRRAPHPRARDRDRRHVAERPAPPHDGYMLRKRTGLFMGRWIRHGGQYPAWHLRLFRSGRSRCEDRLYDQHFVVDGPIGALATTISTIITSDLTPSSCAQSLGRPRGAANSSPARAPLRRASRG